MLQELTVDSRAILAFARAISRMEVQEGTSYRGFGGVLHAMRLYIGLP
jgi:hypothetical protein